MRWFAGAGSLVLVVLLGVALRGGLAAAPATDRDLTAGKALYARNCAACHGPEAKGDGASAAG